MVGAFVLMVIWGGGIAGYFFWRQKRARKPVTKAKEPTALAMAPPTKARGSFLQHLGAAPAVAPMLPSPLNGDTTIRETLPPASLFPDAVKMLDGKFLTLVHRLQTIEWHYLADPQGSSVWQGDSSMPDHKGESFFSIYETKDGRLHPYLPYNEPIQAEDRPVRLWRAIHCPWPNRLYAAKLGALEALSKILPIVAMGIAGMAAFAAISKH